jgi:hypothetical protein
MDENTRAARRVGLTPMLTRLAWHYVKKGLGRHYIDHREYDNVHVEELYNWKVMDGQGQGGLKVSFCAGREVLRVVEIGARVVGASGAPLMKEM